MSFLGGMFGRRPPPPSPTARVDVTARIHDIKTAIATVAGTAAVVFGPVPVHCQWLVDELTTSLSRGTGTVIVNHGPNANAPIFVDVTNIAAQGRSGPPGLSLYPGEQLSLTFAELAVVGGAATVTVTLRARQVPWP